MKHDQQILNIIIEKIQNEHKEDISLLITYGSPKKEDNLGISFYFVPKTERGKAFSIQFIIDGVSYDLFPMSWSRLIANAALDSPQGYLLLETEVHYASDEDDLARFEQLKESLRTLLKGDYSEIKINKAYEYLNETYIYLYNMRAFADNIRSVRMESGKLLNKIANALAFVNGSCYMNGNGTVLRDSLALEKLPKNYRETVDSILFSQNAEGILKHSEDLVTSVRSFLLEQKKAQAQPEPFETLFTGYYEELLKSLNKCRNAVITQDYYQLSELCAFIQEETAQFFAKVESGIWFDDRNAFAEFKDAFEKHFESDFLEWIARKDTKALAAGIERFDRDLVNLIQSNEVPVLSFESPEAFRRHLSERAL